MHHYISGDTILDSKVIDKCVDVYYSYLCKDFYTMFETDMTSLLVILNYVNVSRRLIIRFEK